MQSPLPLAEAKQKLRETAAKSFWRAGNEPELAKAALDALELPADRDSLALLAMTSLDPAIRTRAMEKLNAMKAQS